MKKVHYPFASIITYFMIGVFDSGFGGLTVLREILKIIPDYNYTYLGDQAHVPYGPRSPETLQKFTEKNILFLFEKGAKIVVIACNSATSAALKYLQQKYPEKHILGVIVPASEKALQKTRFGKIGVIGTTATIKSGAYEKEILKATPDYYHPKEKKALKVPKILSAACPLLVPLIEENWIKKPETRMIVRKYLRPLKEHNIDTLVLGCTHYPLLEKIITKNMGKNCRIINSSKEQAFSLKAYLEKHPEVEKTIGKNKKRVFYTTDCPEKFATLGSLFLGTKIEEGEKVEIFT